MSDSRLQPLPDDIAEMLAAERDAVVPVGAEQRVRVRVEQSLAGPPVSAPAPAAASLEIVLIAIAAAVLGIGGATYTLTTAGDGPTPKAVPVVSEHDVAAEPRLHRFEIAVGEPTAHPAPAPAPSDTLAEELAILDRAQAALLARDGATALAAVAEHARRFRRGMLIEEREALRVQALVMAGYHDRARERGARFLARYPRSIQRGAVRVALESIP